MSRLSGIRNGRPCQLEAWHRASVLVRGILCEQGVTESIRLFVASRNLVEKCKNHDVRTSLHTAGLGMANGVGGGGGGVGVHFTSIVDQGLFLVHPASYRHTYMHMG